MTRRYNRVALVILLCFGVVSISLAYWSVFAVDGMLARPDNPRRVEKEWAIQRGALFASDGTLLAESVQVGVSPSGLQLWDRHYLYPEFTGALGYYNRFYGVAGTEKAFDAILTGADQLQDGQKSLNDLLNRPQVGRDVRLTINRELQQSIVTSFTRIGGTAARGGAIVIDVPSGAVRALVSMPVYNANQPDLRAWQRLANQPDVPVRNRVLEGVYQPGGALETVILAALLTDQASPEGALADAAAPVQIDGLRIPCAVTPRAIGNVDDAYAYTCPASFVDAVSREPGPAKIQAMLDAFGLLQPPPLLRFDVPPGIGKRTVTPLSQISNTANLLAAAVGQGELAVTPLQMAVVATTIANRGNGIPFHMGDAVRAIGGDWQSMTQPTIPEKAITTQPVTDHIRLSMAKAVAGGSARVAGEAARQVGLPDGAKLYGHVALAYVSRTTTNAWFLGFLDLADGRSIAIVVLLENTSDVNLAARIGGAALAAAAR